MNITYLLGAGASANAIPIVEKSNYRMELFLDILRQEINKYKIDEKVRKNIKDRVEIYYELYKKLKFYLSYDTYAKKLWLLDKSIELSQLKELISLFYYSEHLPKSFRQNYIEGFLHRNYRSKTEQIKNDYLNKCLDQVDKRYDAFFAGIARKELKEVQFVPPNVNIVTWNYDLQLEMVLRNYGYNAWIYSFNPYDDILNIRPIQNKIVKLNGSCGFKERKDASGNIGLSEYFDSFDVPSCDQFFDVMSKFIGENENSIDTNISFSWEENEYSNGSIKQAEKIFDSTDCLVIIGYSFPLFNRDVDRNLLKRLEIPTNSKIYIQEVDEQKFLQVKARLLGLVEKSTIKEDRIEFIPDVNQFFVPFEFNSEPDYHYLSNKVKK